MPDRKRSEKQIKDRMLSDQSFKIWNPDGTVYAEMFEGKWVKEPKDFGEEPKELTELEILEGLEEIKEMRNELNVLERKLKGKVK